MRSIVVAALALSLISGCTVSPNAAEPAAGSKERPAVWGERHTWPDGLSIELLPPAPCEYGEIHDPKVIERAFMVTVRLTNGSNEPYDPAWLAVKTSVWFAGTEAEFIYDPHGGCHGEDTSILQPGQTVELSDAYAVGAQPGELMFAVKPKDESQVVYFLGRA